MLQNWSDSTPGLTTYKMKESTSQRMYCFEKKKKKTYKKAVVEQFTMKLKLILNFMENIIIQQKINFLILVAGLHDFSVTIPRCYRDVYVNSYLHS